jgi:hypothetical protein
MGLGAALKVVSKPALSGRHKVGKAESVSKAGYASGS